MKSISVVQDNLDNANKVCDVQCKAFKNRRAIFKYIVHKISQYKYITNYNGLLKSQKVK